MVIPGFKFKQFTIMQQLSAMKVGTDGVLLGAWANCTGTKNILDIGTGTGLIALMLAQRCKAFIDAVEIDNAAYTEALLNVQNSPWPNRVNIINMPIQNYAHTCNKKYCLIVSNPPFFENSLICPDNQKTTARHTQNLTPDNLLLIVNMLLNNNGTFNVIIPATAYNTYINTAKTYNLFCNTVLWVVPTPATPAKRALISFSRKQTVIAQNQIIIEDKGRHGYSDEYIALTKDYYLKF